MNSLLNIDSINPLIKYPPLIEETEFFRAAQFDLYNINGRKIDFLAKEINYIKFQHLDSPKFLKFLRDIKIIQKVYLVAIPLLIVLRESSILNKKILDYITIHANWLNKNLFNSMGYITCWIISIIIVKIIPLLEDRAWKNIEKEWLSLYPKEAALLNDWKVKYPKSKKDLIAVKTYLNLLQQVPEEDQTNISACLAKIEQIEAKFKEQDALIYQTKRMMNPKNIPILLPI
ncbi:MAG: hypothetical protein H0W88_05045 [Parachlamydiaceae bacterium]|nr:hypothetical protein [Parachlamydiaceae bacterium]